MDFDEQRGQRAFVIEAHAADWLPLPNDFGVRAYGIPSEHAAGVFYIVTLNSCNCQDHIRHSGIACKHMLAMRLHLLRQVQVLGAGIIDGTIVYAESPAR